MLTTATVDITVVFYKLAWLLGKSGRTGPPSVSVYLQCLVYLFIPAPGYHYKSLLQLSDKYIVVSSFLWRLGSVQMR